MKAQTARRVSHEQRQLCQMKSKHGRRDEEEKRDERKEEREREEGEYTLSDVNERIIKMKHRPFGCMKGNATVRESPLRIKLKKWGAAIGSNGSSVGHLRRRQIRGK